MYDFAIPTKEQIAARSESCKTTPEISALMIQRYAVSIGDRNPLYFDDNYARHCGYEGVIAPPSFLTAILGWEAGPRDEELLDDGNDPSLVPPELAGCALMGGGQALTFFNPVRPGYIVTARTRLADMYRKDTKRGALIFAILDTSYVNQRGVPLLNCRDTLIAAPESY